MSVDAKLAYLAIDRVFSLVNNQPLPKTSQGTALFLDISGFTPLTESLRQLKGEREGVEILAQQLNTVYETLIAEVHQYGGSVIEFSGDAITCWFDANDWNSAPTSAQAGLSCAMAMQEAIQQFQTIQLDDTAVFTLGCKIGIASGEVRRLVVGNPQFRLFDVLLGTPIDRMAQAESLADSGQIMADQQTLKLGEALQIQATSLDNEFVLIERIEHKLKPKPWPEIPTEADLQRKLDEWLLPDVSRQLNVGLGEYPPELRLVVALFLRFERIDSRENAETGSYLNEFIKWAQQIVYRYGGNIIQVSVEHKGSYLYAVFGAPITHEDDAYRAVSAALELSQPAQHIQVQIGISQGIMRTGAYGSQRRRTYGVQGDEVNLAARLMQRTAPGTVMVTGYIRKQTEKAFIYEDLPATTFKGKQETIRVAQLIQRRHADQINLPDATPYVGRENEFERMRIWLAPIFTGQNAGLIYVRGDAGIGKSRFLNELRLRLQQKHHVQWFVAPTDEVMPLALTPFTRWLKYYFQQRPDHSQADNLAQFNKIFFGLLHTIRLSTVTSRDLRLQLERVYPFLVALLGLPIHDRLYQNVTSNFRMQQFITAIQTLILVESQLQPVVLVLEDGQWLDKTSHQLLQELHLHARQYALAIIITSRETITHQTGNLGKKADSVQHDLILGQLDQVGVQTLGQQLLGGDLADSFAEILTQKTEGNPFFVEQLIFDLQERDALIQQDDYWQMKTSSKSTDYLPNTINTVLVARLDRLTAQVKSVVQAASVLGHEFELQILVQMLQRHDTSRRVTEAEKEGIWQAMEQLRYLFRHALLRDAAYAMQVEDRRRVLHELAAQAIELLHPDDESQTPRIAQHWRDANQLEKAIAYTLRAVEYLNIIGDYQEIGRLVQQGLDVLTDIPEHVEHRAQLLRWQGHYLMLLSDFGGAKQIYEEVLQNAETINNLNLIAQALEGLAESLWKLGNYDEALACAERALTLSKKLVNKKLIATSLLLEANIMRDMGDYELAIQPYKEALASIEDTDEILLQTQIITALAGDYTYLGQTEEAKTYLLRNLRILEEIGFQYGLGRVYASLGNVVDVQGNHAEADMYYQRALEIFQALNITYQQANIFHNVGWSAFMAGDYNKAIHYLHESLILSQNLEDWVNVADTQVFLAYPLFERQELATVYRYLIEAVDVAYPIRNHRIILNVLGHCARLHYYVHEDWQRALYLLGFIDTMPGLDQEVIDTFIVSLLDAIKDRPDVLEVERLLAEGANLDYETIIQEEMIFLRRSYDETQAE